MALNSKGVKLSVEQIKDMAEKGSTAQVKVMFQGKEKRSYTPRKPKDGAESAPTA